MNVHFQPSRLKKNGPHLDGFNDNNVTSLFASSSNFIPVTPAIFCEKFENIRALVLIGVQLREMTDNSFSSCYHLRTLYLSYNRIRVVTADVFRNNLELIELRLPDNEITRIADNSFRNLAKLQYLEFNRNRIMEINERTFSGLNSLIELSLQTNSIMELTSVNFSDLLNIQLVLLFSNRIDRIHPNFLETLPQRNFTLDLSNNLCISSRISFTVEDVGDLKTLFSQCFENYHYDEISINLYKKLKVFC